MVDFYCDSSTWKRDNIRPHLRLQKITVELDAPILKPSMECLKIPSNAWGCGAPGVGFFGVDVGHVQSVLLCMAEMRMISVGMSSAKEFPLCKCPNLTECLLARTVQYKGTFPGVEKECRCHYTVPVVQLEAF